METVLGRNLSIIIKREGVKIQCLASAADVTSSTIHNIMSGRRTTKLDTLGRILNAIGYDLYLVSPDGKKHKYISVSRWFRYIQSYEKLDIWGLSALFDCCEITVDRYLLDERSPDMKLFEKFTRLYDYSIKIVKGDIEYNLFEPIDIWQGKFEWM